MTMLLEQEPFWNAAKPIAMLQPPEALTPAAWPIAVL
jgi:hypothetical protein